MDEIDTLFEIALVVSVQIGKMNLQPPQTTLAEGPRLAKQEQTTTEIIPNVTQMGRNGVSTTTEINVVREIQSVAQEL